VHFDGLCRFDPSPKEQGHIDESEIRVEMLSGTRVLEASSH
jgi:hypothetical protein